MTHRIYTIRVLLIFIVHTVTVLAFTSPALQLSTTAARSHSNQQAQASDTSGIESIAAERFVVTNQFKVKKGREAAFEKRWADRESRLGTLDGFRFFCILRRVEDKDAQDDINYVSCTVWQTFDNFQVWRTGDAFKEAHGGGTVGGVASMLMATVRNTKGKPVPAYFQGLLPVTLPGTPPIDGEGWRKVEATGVDMLDKECFVAMNRFSVSEGSQDTFEQRFANRDSILTDFKGFRGFMLLRRDGGKKPSDGIAPADGYTHSTFSVWENKACFEAWRSYDKKPGKPDISDKKSTAPPAGRPNIFQMPPVASFYEGILVLESAKGL